MKTIKDYLPTASSAVRAMINGLRNQSERKDFKVDMVTFGYSEGNICFGCAATCAIQEAVGVNFTANAIGYRKRRSEMVRIRESDLDRFENAIDDLRFSFPVTLFVYYGIYKRKEVFDTIYATNLPILHSDDWGEGLPTYEKLAEALEKVGL